MTARFDKLGLIVAPWIAYSIALAPFATFRANRIIQGEPRSILEALPQPLNFLLVGLMVAVALLAVFRTPPLIRLSASLAALLALTLFIGLAATHLTPRKTATRASRRPPASGSCPSPSRY